MVPWARWLVVAVSALALVAAPLVPLVLPVHDSPVGAPRLAQRILASPEQGWSGEVRARGSLQVPLTGSTFGGVARLLGEESTLRVWWRGPEDWRIDRLRATGESDLVRNGGLSVRWNYEDNRVNFTPFSRIRLPNDSDLVPSSLAVRMLTGAAPAELSRLPARRVAGRSAPGLRLVPADERSTIAHVDVWADVETGLPLRVEVYADPAGAPVLATELVSLDPVPPPPGRTDFQLSPTLDFSRGVSMDDAAGANAFAPFVPPAAVAGLSRLGREADFGAVGVYGRGPTALLAIPLRSSVARALRAQLRRSPESREDGRGIAMEIGPLSVRLEQARSGNFLLTGTVTAGTLEDAATDIAAGVVRTR